MNTALFVKATIGFSENLFLVTFPFVVLNDTSCPSKIITSCASKMHVLASYIQLNKLTLSLHMIFYYNFAM